VVGIVGTKKVGKGMRPLSLSTALLNLSIA